MAKKIGTFRESERNDAGLITSWGNGRLRTPLFVGGAMIMLDMNFLAREPDSWEGDGKPTYLLHPKIGGEYVQDTDCGRLTADNAKNGKRYFWGFFSIPSIEGDPVSGRIRAWSRGKDDQGRELFDLNFEANNRDNDGASKRRDPVPAGGAAAEYDDEIPF